MGNLISTSVMAVIMLSNVQDRKTVQEDAVLKFIRAFFSEDEKTLLAISTGRAASDLKTYFWIKRKIQGDSTGVPRKWEGKIVIFGSDREKVLAADIFEADGSADIFKVAVDGKLFRCGLDETNKIILFNEPSK
jgi:hypothetical protein